ncbi:MAG: xanthine dehydrogenase family protein molybdopterin-binding subunit [Phenylobacterium sp.]|uniref:xanthine dehydrogenase family protein molybdopterin-binding subunit n=1 Tax=Phenylobacterium sp. TaxID=1871053 RepID=UPI0027338378|nr:xanthine dehydrogenase family protein molybdopterin-binding subunit [Phenylobacterium sp.]MDP3748843.1 xanthine dehydrogenase family protein molybdopterin-binding subunit [Phenylobacterium sp.]
MNDSRSAPRLEARLKVTGQARYSAETQIPGLLHAALVTAPIARGRVTDIDASRAERLPGFVAIMTHENAAPLARAAAVLHLQGPEVRFAGEPVAVVIARSPIAARRAAAAVDVVYEAEPAATDFDLFLGEAYAPRTAGRTPTDSLRGDPEDALARARVSLDLRYETAANNHHPMEPQSVIADWGPDLLTVYTTTQAVFAHRAAIAGAFGLEVEKVRVVCEYLGGGFGAKGGAWYPGMILGIQLARHVGAPVRLELTRAQMFTLVGRRQETRQHLRLGADGDGRLTAIALDTVAPTSTYAEYADAVATTARMMYACPNVATTHRLVRLNAPQPNPMRAPGEGPGSFALESAMDELAHELQLDPLELRLRNFAVRDQNADLSWSSNGLRECYQVGAEAFGWAGRPLAPGALRDGRRTLGWGMAAVCYPVYSMASAASVALESDGGIVVRCGTQDMGTGTITVLGQLAAAILDVPLARVRVEIGDTLLPEGPYSGGSIATASFTPAVEAAARDLRTRLITLASTDPASSLLGEAQPDLVLEDGHVRSLTGNRSESLAALAGRAAPGGLEAFAQTTPDPDRPVSAFGFGAVFAEVAVDPELGEVRLKRLTAAYAAGRILNPLLARSQYVGGLIGGIGMALHEATVDDKASGRVLGDNLADYLIPVQADMPAFDVHMIHEDDPHLPGGIKGIGMLGTVGTAGAIANAVFHATGVRIRRLPIRIEDCIVQA